MGLHKLRADWLDDTVTTALSVSCIKAYPGWDRPTKPAGDYAAILWSNDVPSERRRIGEAFNRYASQFTLYLVSGSEVGLWGLLDSVETMAQDYTTATINSTRHKVAWGVWERSAFPEDATEDMRYTAQVIVTIGQELT